jgi:hypothetical protein
MNSPSNIPSANGTGSDASKNAALKDVDATLRLMATLPPPAGLEDRVFARVLAGPRPTRVLEWPQPFYTGDWVRSIAAALIVFVIGGGGWGIYSHVQQNQTPTASASPRQILAPGSFSSAEMIRRPQTLKGPVVVKPEPIKAAKAQNLDRKANEKARRSSSRVRPTAKTQQAAARSRVAK